MIKTAFILKEDYKAYYNNKDAKPITSISSDCSVQVGNTIVYDGFAYQVEDIVFLLARGEKVVLVKSVLKQ